MTYLRIFINLNMTILSLTPPPLPNMHACTVYQLLRMSLVITVIGFKVKISNINRNNFYIWNQPYSNSQNSEELKSKNYTLVIDGLNNYKCLIVHLYSSFKCVLPFWLENANVNTMLFHIPFRKTLNILKCSQVSVLRRSLRLQLNFLFFLLSTDERHWERSGLLKVVL